MNKIIGFGLLLVAFASCSEETPIEPPYETGTFTLNFTMEDGVKTKADPGDVSDHAANYSYTTEDELYIDNCFVAAFVKQTGDADNEWSGKVFAEKYTFTNGLVILKEKVGSFSIENMEFPIKANIKIIAIANFPEDNYSPATYSELSKKLVSYGSASVQEDYYTFDPKSLIKVGEETIRFEGTRLESKQIQLKQLGAKIRLNLSFASGSFTAFKLEEISINNVELQSKLISPEGAETSMVSGRYTHQIDKILEQSIDDIYFYTYAKAVNRNTAQDLTVQLKGIWGKDKETFLATNRKTFNLYINENTPIEAGNYYEVKGALQQNISSIKIYIKNWNTENVGVSYN